MKIDVLTLFPNMFDGFLKESIIKRMRTGLVTPFVIPESKGQLCATLLSFDNNNQCTSIQRICIDPFHTL